jgi:hypothetical protein
MCVCISGILEVIINHVLMQNGSELEKSVPAVKQYFYLIAVNSKMGSQCPLLIGNEVKGTGRIKST